MLKKKIQLYYKTLIRKIFKIIYGQVKIDRGGHALHADFVKYIWKELLLSESFHDDRTIDLQNSHAEGGVKLVNE